MDSTLKIPLQFRQVVALLVALISATILMGSVNLQTWAKDPPLVVVTQIVEHPALNATRDGLKAELEKAGYKAGSTLKWEWESAQGNPTTAAQIANKFVGETPDVIVTISTPSSQTVAAVNQEIPQIFTSVTDPLGAKLVTNLEKPGGLVTGVSNLAPIASHLDLIKQIAPTTKKVGVLYNAGEANARTLVNLLKQNAPAKELEIVEATVARSSDVATAAQSLVGKVDGIYIPNDNTVVSALESAIKVGIDNKLPIYAGDTDSVKRGAMAALGFDYFEVGELTGQMVVRVLKGEKPGDIPVLVMAAQKQKLLVNLKSAQAMGVKIPEAVIAKADQVIQ